jgi:holo-[acyl-carrier protein] synthase
VNNDLYIGTDVVSVPRIGRLLNSALGNKFKSRVFTKVERLYCEQKSDPRIHFAGRFAAKEALYKAYKSALTLEVITLKELEIISGEFGEPELNLPQRINRSFSSKVSISHTDEIAVAFAIVKKNK